MNDYERDRNTPLFIMAVLLAIGATGTSGQRRLKTLKRFCGWSFVLLLLAAPLILLGSNAYLTISGTHLTKQADEAVLLSTAAAVIWSVISAIFWCYLAVAKWLTKDDDEYE